MKKKTNLHLEPFEIKRSEVLKYLNKAIIFLAPSYFNVTLGDQQKPKKGLKCKSHRNILKNIILKSKCIPNIFV